VIDGVPLWTNGSAGTFLRGEPPEIWKTGGFSGQGTVIFEHGDTVYVADNYSLATFDPQTLAVRPRRFFGPLQLALPEVGERYLYRMRLLLRGIDVVDPVSTRTVRRIPLDIVARYLAVADSRGLLFVPDFLGDTAVLIDDETGRQVGEVRVGRRPRGAIWSERQQAFLGTSSCGLFRLPIDGLDETSRRTSGTT